MTVRGTYVSVGTFTNKSYITCIFSEVVILKCPSGAVAFNGRVISH
jgi:hypothetical protein